MMRAYAHGLDVLGAAAPASKDGEPTTFQWTLLGMGFAAITAFGIAMARDPAPRRAR